MLSSGSRAHRIGAVGGRKTREANSLCREESGGLRGPHEATPANRIFPRRLVPVY